MQIAYRIVVCFAHILLRIVALFNPKINAFLNERKTVWEDLEKWSEYAHSKPVICFHCASLGEYEMIVPVISSPKIQEKYTVVLSFFSSSGYKHAKPGDLVKAKFYLPLDSRKNMSRFVELLHPEKFVFVKYDLWYHLIGALQQAKVEVFLVNALIRPKQFITSFWGRVIRKRMQTFNHIFVQDNASNKRLHGLGFSNVSVSGDLRFDRVSQLKSAATEDNRFTRFAHKKTTLILGSSWQAEEVFLSEFMQDSSLDFQVIIAPHDIGTGHISQIQNLFKDYDVQLFSEEERDSRILVLDNIGLLSKAYASADLAVIGGGFGNGLHNILEAAVWGMPILTGPNIQNFPEAIQLKEIGCLQTMDSSKSSGETLHEWLSNPSVRKNKQESMLQWFSKKTGATEMVLDVL